MLPVAAAAKDTDWTKPKISSLDWVVAAVSPLLGELLVPLAEAVPSRGAGRSPENSLTLIPLPVLVVGKVQVMTSPPASAITPCADTIADLPTPPPPAATFCA